MRRGLVYFSHGDAVPCACYKLVICIREWPRSFLFCLLYDSPSLHPATDFGSCACTFSLQVLSDSIINLFYFRYDSDLWQCNLWMVFNVKNNYSFCQLVITGFAFSVWKYTKHIDNTGIHCTEWSDIFWTFTLFTICLRLLPDCSLVWISLPAEGRA